MNDSSTGGYLAPSVAAPPAEDDALDDLLQMMVCGITGLDGSLVRPRWQPTVPKQPEPSVNWCALGVSVQTNDAGPAIRHEGSFLDNVIVEGGTEVVMDSGPVLFSDGDGRDTYIRHQDIELLCSFYGPSAKGYVQRLADGMSIPQNHEQLGQDDMAFVSASEIRAASDLVNQQWVRRYDMTIYLRRKISRTYPVLNLRSAQASTTTDSSPPIGGTVDASP